MKHNSLVEGREQRAAKTYTRDLTPLSTGADDAEMTGRNVHMCLGARLRDIYKQGDGQESITGRGVVHDTIEDTNEM